MVDRLWYGSGRPLWPLWPLAWLFRWITRRRREAYRRGRRTATRPPVPVIVVGNITAGGTGKSPLTLAIVEHLKANGWRPAIVSRGYGGKADRHPLLVQSDTPASACGDEPRMLADQGQVPVIVDPVRARGAVWAYDEGLADVLVCDDGLQHYALGRDIELAVFDGERGLGNGAPIPVGPLREEVARVSDVDAVIFNGQGVANIEHPHSAVMQLEPVGLVNVASGERQPAAWLSGRTVTAIAGIGNPERFFRALRRLGADVSGRALPDHHEIQQGDLERPVGCPLIMTAKDAVKCRSLVDDNCWALEIRASLPETFWTMLDRRLAELTRTPV